MSDDPSFHAAYQDLERRMNARSEADGHVYVPNPTPNGPVEYVFVCMEPSFGRIADSNAEAREKVEAGFRNFLYSMDDFILHFCINRYLCRAGEQYHITDLSKGAMLVEDAGQSRSKRYDRWYPLLEDEIALVARPNATVFAVGKQVEDYLNEQGLESAIRILHYSPQAGNQRNQSVAGDEEQFEAFRQTVAHASVLATARHVLQHSGMSQPFCDQTIDRLKRRRLTESRRKLMYVYKRAFESLHQEPA
jgi:hypothetical protein